MGFLDRLTDQSACGQQPQQQPDDQQPDAGAPVEAPQAEGYRAGALEGLPASGDASACNA